MPLRAAANNVTNSSYESFEVTYYGVACHRAQDSVRRRAEVTTSTEIQARSEVLHVLMHPHKHIGQTADL
jgi:hypothetical protein